MKTAVLPHERLKIRITCKQCGEMYTLRGRRREDAHIETGFKQCICDNCNEFDWECMDE